MTVITHIADLQALAKKRVPKMFYDYADSGSWTESTYRANEDDFQKIKFRQRVAVNMEGRNTATTMVIRATLEAMLPKAAIRSHTLQGLHTTAIGINRASTMPQSSKVMAAPPRACRGVAAADESCSAGRVRRC